MLVTRLGLIVAFDVAPTSDAAWYYGRALELIDTGQYAELGIPTAYWPVGYPAFLAGVMMVFGQDVLVGQIANMILSILCALLLYRFCRERLGNEQVAGIAALLLALYPNHMGYSVGLYSEPLYTVLLLLVFVLVRPGATTGRLVLAGFALGLATLVKAQTQLLGPMLVFFLLLDAWGRGSIRRAVGGAVIVTLGMTVTVAPWTYRNYLVLGSPIPVSTNGGMSLLAGNNPSMQVGMSRNYAAEDSLINGVSFSVADQVAADRRAREAAVAWITENPIQFFSLVPWKLWRLWAYDGESEWIFQAGYRDYPDHVLKFRVVRVINQVYYFAVLLLGVWGMTQVCRVNLPHTLAVAVLLVFFSLLSMVFSGQSRYHAPLMPFLIGFAAFALNARLNVDRRFIE